MKNNYKISVIIPAYNAQKTLKRMVESIINQTIGFENIELIIVDDNSNDDTANIIKEYMEKYPNVQGYFLEKNSQASGKPRNIGLKHATADYVAFADADDQYVENSLETLYNEIVATDVDLVSSNFYIVLPDQINPNNTIFNGENIKIENLKEDTRILNTSPSLWSKIFKRDFLIDNNITFVEGVFGQDAEFMVHCYILANGIVYLDDFYSYNYIERNNEDDKSVTNLKNKYSLTKLVDGYFSMYNILKDLNKMEYFQMLFKMHFDFWFLSLIESNTTYDEKKELLIYSSPLTKKLFAQTSIPSDIWDVPQLIVNDEYDEAVEQLIHIKNGDSREEIEKENGFLARIKRKLNF